MPITLSLPSENSPDLSITNQPVITPAFQAAMNQSSSSQLAYNSPMAGIPSALVEIKVMGGNYRGNDLPWYPMKNFHASGSGFVIQGQKIITNAHVIEGCHQVEVRLACDSKYYKAQVVLTGAYCDLALLKVSDQSFWEKASFVQIGEMMPRESEIQVFGFPMGSTQWVANRGIISNFEPDYYMQGGIDHLVARIDAAMNPGNSGGPVIAVGPAVVGVASNRNQSKNDISQESHLKEKAPTARTLLFLKSFK